MTLLTTTTGCGRISRSHVSADVNLDGVEPTGLCDIDFTASDLVGMPAYISQLATNSDLRLSLVRPRSWSKTAILANYAPSGRWTKEGQLDSS